MLQGGCQPAMRSALVSTATGRQARRATQRALLVISASSGNGSNGAGGPRLTPDEQRRAVSVLSGARLLDFRKLGNQLGGTLVVDDASHKKEVQQAVKEGNISFGFSAGGCLFPYYIGVAGTLMDAGILTEDVKIGGASAGSLLAACLKSRMPLDNIVEQNMRLMHDLRQGGTRGRLGPVLKTFLHHNLPEDAHLHCQDRAYVAVTKVTPIARPVLVSRFNDREDLIQALMTSCHIPFWMDGNAFTEFRGERHCDGGLTNFIPLPPGTVGIRVCCFPSKQLSPVYRIGISPDSFEPWDYTLRQMVQWAFEPADEAIVTALIEKGKKDTHAWMDTMELSGLKEQAEERQRQDVGQVAAAKEAAAGTADTGRQRQAEREGQVQLEQRAVQDAGAAAPAQAAAEAGPAAQIKEQQAAGEAGMQRQAVEEVARKQDEGASRQEQQAAAEEALREAEEKEAEGGNIWARALAAAGMAASAAAVATAVTASGGL